MRGRGLDAHAERRGFAPEALRTDAQSVDALGELALQRVVIGIGMRTLTQLHQRFLGQQRHLLEGAADAHAQHHGRAGIGARHARCLHHKIPDALQSLGRGEHAQAAHVFASKSLGRDGEAQPVARNQPQMQHRGRIVAGVSAPDGIAHDGLAQIAVRIPAADALVDRVLQKSARDVRVLAQFSKDHRHARILADGHAALARHVGVVANQLQRFPRRREGLRFAGSVQQRPHRLRQQRTGFDAQPRDRRGDVLIAYLPALSHGHGLLHRYQSSVMRSTSQGFPQRGRCTGLPAPAEMTIRPSATP